MNSPRTLFFSSILIVGLGFPSRGLSKAVNRSIPSSPPTTVAEAPAITLDELWQRGHLEGILAFVGNAEASGLDGNEWLYKHFPPARTPVSGDTGRAQFDAFVALLQEAERLHTWADAFPAYSVGFRALASDRLESVARSVQQHLEAHPHLERTFRYRYMRKRLDEQKYHISMAPPPKWVKAMERFSSKGLGYVLKRTWSDTNWAMRILGLLTVLFSGMGFWCMAKFCWTFFAPIKPQS